MKELILILIFVIFLTGFFSKTSIEERIVVSAAFLIGSCGLYVMWKSAFHNSLATAWFLLLLGFLIVVMAKAFLDSLLRRTEPLTRS